MERLPREDLEKIVDELFAWSDKIAHDAMRRIVEKIKEPSEEGSNTID